MKLYGSPRSPYVRKVRIVLEEKGLAYEYVVDRAGLPEANPLAKVPTLIVEEGKAIFDSPVIVEYLDGIAPTPRLIPEAFEDRIEVKRWEALGDGIVDATVAISHERQKPQAQQEGEEWYQKQQQKIERGLAAMTISLRKREFCYGEKFSLADIAAGYALGYLDQRLSDFQWRKSFLDLKQLSERLQVRDSFRKTLPSA
jgi:glutathione S-transferase